MKSFSRIQGPQGTAHSLDFPPRIRRVRRSRRISRRLMAACARLVLGVSCSSFAVRADEDAAVRVSDQASMLRESWRWRVFDRDDGLNSNAVTALFQDRDTTKIYAATRLGVCLYDLWQWSVLETRESPTEEIVEFAQSQEQVYGLSARVLWKVQAGTRLQADYRGENLHLASGRPGELYLLDGANRKHFMIRGDIQSPIDEDASPVQFPAGHVYDYASGPERRHWIATSVSLYSRDLRHARWKALEDREVDDALSGLQCRRLFRVVQATPPERREVRDELWAAFGPRAEAAEQWSLARLENGVWERIATDVPARLFQRILLDHNGVYHATNEDGQLFLSSTGETWMKIEELGIGSVALHAGLIDTAGICWFRLGAGGIGAFDPESRRWTRLPLGKRGVYPNVLSLIETQDGEIWAGTDSGVTRVRDAASPPEVYEDASGVTLSKITGLADDASGRIWVSSFVGFKGACCFDGNWSRVLASGLSDEYIARIVKDWRQELWFLPHQGGAGERRWIYRHSVETGEKFAEVDLDGEGYSVNDLLRTRSSEFWLATDRGLRRGRIEEAPTEDHYRFRTEKHYTVGEGLLSSSIWAAVEGPDGSIWVCYRDPDAAGGVSRLREDGGQREHRIESFYDMEGQGPTWSIRTLGDDVWFGTDNGLTRFDGECFYSYRVASTATVGSTVWPLFPSLREPGTLLIGTLGHGAWSFRKDDRIRPRFSSQNLPREVGPDGNVTFEWQARDYRSQTASDELLYRTRLDGEPWTGFQRDLRVRRLEGLATGDHSFEIEVRDLDGNRSRELLFHRFSVGRSEDAWDAWLLAAECAGGALAVIVAVLLLTKAAERRRRLGRYRTLFRTYPGPVFILDSGGRVIDYNRSRLELIGLGNERREDVLGRPLQLLPVFSLKEIEGRLKRLLEGEAFSVQNHRWLRGGEEERVCRVQGFPLVDDTGAPGGAVVLLEDRTRAVEEESLREREARLRSLRSMARGVTASLDHVIDDVQNLVTGGGQTGERRSEILGRIRHAEAIVESLAAFSGETDGFSALAALPINELLEGLLQRHEKDLESSSGLRVDFRGQVGVWAVRGEETRLSEAFLAVLCNATEAMGETGMLTVQTANRRVEGDTGVLADGPYVEVTIRDTGPGMDAAHRERALEPFFTTKSRERYLGVGLSLAYGVIRAHGGDLRIDSQVGGGTVVRVFLPRA